MERHKFTSLARHLREIENQLTTLATNVGALNMEIYNLLSENHNMIDSALGHDRYQKSIADNMARDLILIEGTEGVRKYYTKDGLWNWEKWNVDSLDLRRQMKELDEAISEIGVSGLEEQLGDHAQHEGIRDVEGRQGDQK